MVVGFEAEPRKADRPSRLVPRPRGAPAAQRAAVRRASAIQSHSLKKEKRRRQNPLWYARLEGDFLQACVLKRTEKERLETSILLGFILRKEVIQPQVPLRLPCYDFTPVAEPTVVACLLAVSATPSGKPNSHGVTGGVYKARERIHRGMLIHDY